MHQVVYQFTYEALYGPIDIALCCVSLVSVRLFMREVVRHNKSILSLKVA